MQPLNITFERPSFKVSNIVACSIENGRTSEIIGFNIVAQSQTGQFSILDTIGVGKSFVDRRIKELELELELELEPSKVVVCPLEDRKSRVRGFNIIVAGRILETLDVLPTDYVHEEVNSLKAEFKIH